METSIIYSSTTNSGIRIYHASDRGSAVAFAKQFGGFVMAGTTARGEWYSVGIMN